MSRQNEREAIFDHDAPASVNENTLRTALEVHQKDLMTGIRVYLWKFGAVTQRSELEDKAKEILQETAVEALGNADHYDPTRPVKLWLLGIAINRIRQMQRARYRQSRVVVSIHETTQAQAIYQHSPVSTVTEDDLFDLIHHDNASDKLSLTEMLSVVDQADREILSLRFIEDLTGEELAAALGTSVGAAYVRLSRAKNRLRQQFRKGETI